MTTQKAGRPTGKTGQAKVLDDKELKRVLCVVESGNHAKRNAAIIILSNYLGLRSKELAALKMGDVLEHDTIKKVLRLVAAYTKGAKHRDVSLENKAVVKALQEYIAVRQDTTYSIGRLRGIGWKRHSFRCLRQRFDILQCAVF